MPEESRIDRKVLAPLRVFNIFVWFTATQRIRRCNREQRRELLALPAIEAHE